MKVVLDENFWDEKRQVHPNLDETVPNRSVTSRLRCNAERACPYLILVEIINPSRTVQVSCSLLEL